MSVQHKLSVKNEEVTKTFYVSECGHTTIVCPACHNAKTIAVGLLRKRQYKIKVSCPCSNIFMAKLDYRKAYRKLTSFTGIYSLHHLDEYEGLATVKDLSLNGICFETTGIHSMSIGQKGLIDFTLDDKRKTRLKKEFAVRSVNGNIFGCEFVKDQAYEKDLGFYLRPGL